MSSSPKRPLSPPSEATECKRPKRERKPKMSVSALNASIVPEWVSGGDGLLHVKPYEFTYQAFAKQRWIGRRLVEVFNAEFMPRTPTFILESVKEERILVNEAPVGEDYVIKDSDSITNLNHRHELAIREVDLEVLVETDDFLVVNKPSSWPVHPTGRFHFNSLTSILSRRYGYEGLRIAHRLDRPTSGVLVFTRNATADRKIKTELTERKLSKEYVALVDGVFPEGHHVVDKPIDVLLHSLGVQYVSKSETAKECVTEFKRLATNGKVSLVAAYPKTGRTHQIRVHLQWLGFPIERDYLYNSSVWGPQRGKGGDFGGQSAEEVGRALRAEHGFEKFEQRRLTPAEALASLGAESYRAWCPQCHVVQSQLEAAGDELNLHCRRYASGDEWAFTAPLPPWAAALLPDDDPLRGPVRQFVRGEELLPPPRLSSRKLPSTPGQTSQ